MREPGVGEIRPARLPAPGPDDVLVRTLRSGVSRGTETLVFRGGVPADQYAAMRAPFQEGDFPGPVKYGYLSVGVVESGPPSAGDARSSACTRTRPPTSSPPRRSSSCPTACPPRRAVLAGAVETAVNALWDAAPLVGDRVAVVGAGMVGCCVARLLAGIPGTRVTLVDVDPTRAGVAAALGVGFAAPADADDGCDLVVHTSATSAGLQRSLDLLAPEGTVLELSWYGDREVTLAARRGLPLRTAPDPGQPGRHRGRGATGATYRPRTGWGSRSALLRDPALRRPAHRYVALRRAAVGPAPAGRRDPAGALPQPDLRGGLTCSA